MLRTKSADNIAAGYKSYADYAKYASKLEKERLLEDVISKANQLQR